MKTSRFARLAVTGLFIAMLVLQVGAVQGAQASANSVVAYTVSKADLAAAQALWTHAAMANAKPIPMPVDNGKHPVVAVPDVAGPSGSAPSGAADPNAVSIAQKDYPADWQAAAVDAGVGVPASGTPGVFTSYYANLGNMQTLIPHAEVGRLFISGTPGSGYCSASALGGNVMVTAAHCVYDLGTHHFFSSWAFSPAYRNGSAPYGTFFATQCFVLTAWTTQPSYSISGATPYDLAMCKMGNNSGGHSLNSMVGNLGYVYGVSYDLSIYDLGYPWNDYNNTTLPNAGKYLRICSAESFEKYSGVLGMGCNLGPGISGGPWIPNYAPYQSGFVNQVNSVNSGFFVGQKNLYGIHFTSSNFVPLCTASAC